ncbi:Hypothetical predicted protein [Olea europaea subsp. europaea]|uniref:Uncharacterized protein n=3 Tax=Olea europaea subsp. europaea TaxID=158383 RepID=A0A8S0SL28_OLEEU|nr:Hypothetical predicted protein [Olea europaea subsp. europaea]
MVCTCLLLCSEVSVTRLNILSDVHCAVMLPKEATVNTQCEPQLELLNCAEVSNMMKIEICSNGESNLLNYNNLKMDEANSSASFVSNVDIEKGMPESGKSVVNLKHDDSLARELLTEITLWVRGKFVQPLMNHRPERVRDKPTTNGSRKYKRLVSLNSRRVLLLFSALSSVGTVILIYLTLRMRLTGDVSGTGKI